MHSLQREQPLQIPLSDFLKQNDHGLLDSCNELTKWYLFLNYTAYLLNTDHFFTRGSCIAQAVFQIFSEKLLREKDDNDLDIKESLTPYITINDSLRLGEFHASFTPQEQKLIDLITIAINKKNIDIYVELATQEEINFLSSVIKKSFTNSKKVFVSKLRLLPNGIAALEIEVKGGYMNHTVVLALKPPLKNDLRKKMSARQMAAQGKILKVENEWFVEVAPENTTKILSDESLVFLEHNLELPQLLLQTARALRFNAIYPTKNKGENSISATDLTTLVQQIKTQLKTYPINLNNEQEHYILAQSMNEFMLAFLHNPQMFIEFIQQLPKELFPYISRRHLKNNSQKICKLLENDPEFYFTTPKEDHVDLTDVASLLTGSRKKSIHHSKVAKKYGKTIKSIDEKIDLTEMLGQQDTHTTWYFSEYIDYYLFQLLFQPIQL